MFLMFNWYRNMRANKIESEVSGARCKGDSTPVRTLAGRTSGNRKYALGTPHVLLEDVTLHETAPSQVSLHAGEL